MAQKTIASVWSQRGKRIGRSETNKIVQEIKNYAVRSDLRKKIRYYKFGAGGTDSLQNITKNLGGRTAVDKFLRAKIEHDKEQVAEKNKETGGGKAVKTGDARSYLTEKQIARNLNYARRQRINESGAMDRGSISEQYGGGKVESHGVMQQHATMENIGVSWNRKNGDKLGGFAAQNFGSKLPNNPAPPQSLPAGIRPLGL